jgi:hypothetical protein
MAKVRIVVRPTGSINGADWPEVGKTIDLPDVVAEAMASAGNVEVVAVEKRPAPTKGVEKRGGRGRSVAD